MLTHFPAQTHYSEFKPLGPRITLRVPRLCLSCPLETPPDSHVHLLWFHCTIFQLGAGGGGGSAAIVPPVVGPPSSSHRG